ncbi:RNA polymerase sigma factor [Acetivibrio straminisolvens]|uniref:RNA polymerase n=1 Tax=Acetivibrio straminisolvens JCM 21531 TaxID=1294263 RepID=W4VC51_9FIRM|nr:RNA polymerase sigma factor [Acetivibrio straminisolvens]GAE90334.1 RNA polymerase [Acetivibrio straminisolvens JCM 21531]
MKTFEELCQENYSRIYKYIFSMTGSKESTEDLIQEVFLIAYEKGEAFLQHEKPAAFLYKTARNMTATYLKQLKRQKISTVDYLPENIPKDDSDLCETLLNELDRQIDETAYTGQVIGNLNINQHNLYNSVI